MATQNADSHGLAHVMSKRMLIGIFLALVALTWITVGVTKVDFGPTVNLVVAMVIAGIKGILVVLFFMHLLYDRPFNMVVFVGCLVFVVIFITLAMVDSAAYQPSIDPYKTPEGLIKAPAQP
ncbi:MAG: cytochrome C oxidase subunit IV family protein [Phycisphaerae bacterium]